MAKKKVKKDTSMRSVDGIILFLLINVLILLATLYDSAIDSQRHKEAIADMYGACQVELAENQVGVEVLNGQLEMCARV